MSVRPARLYNAGRAELLPFVPPSARRILDVGCARGAFGRTLRASRAGLELHGLDPFLDPDEGVYDRVFKGFFPEALGEEPPYDLILFNDVLEHMAEPEQALQAAVPRLRPEGRVLASLPNVRHIRVLLDLVLRGRWDYRESGILDRTHLRFFTRVTAIELFERCDYAVETTAPLNVGWPDGPSSPSFSRILKAMRGANRVAGGRLSGFLALQYVVVARPRRNDSHPEA